MNTAAIQGDWTGRVIDRRFTLLKWLGGSGDGGVFLTELEGAPPLKAAIKLIGANTAGAELRMAGWAAAAPLSHPHLIRQFHRGRCQIDGAPLLYVVTEYADEVLSEILPTRPLTPAEAGEMLGPVLDALSYLHGKGLAHGRLRPSNILVVNDQLKLSSDRLQTAGEPCKPVSPLSAYDAPELASGELSQDADVWSLGVTLVEALTQHPPLREASAKSDPAVPESVPEPFAGIAQECLRRDPARRCTVSDIVARLQPPPPQKVRPEKTTRPAAGRFRVAWAIAAILVAAAAIAALYIRSQRVEPASPADEVVTITPSAADPATAKPSAATLASAKPSAATRSAARPSAAAPSAVPPSAVPSEADASAGDASQGATVSGVVAQRVAPDLLPEAIGSISGQVNVEIRLKVDRRGEVTSAEFDSPGTSRYFSRISLEAAQKWKFKPARVNGEAVPSTWVLKFHFTQAASEITPLETSP